MLQKLPCQQAEAVTEKFFRNAPLCVESAKKRHVPDTEEFRSISCGQNFK
uniref:Uncharacterized protein n=1 Tax=Anguilla anguilla TaxID=7936 RepID=A0A0E9WJG7_ANGAN